MLRSALRVRVAAPFALAALTLGMPSVAVAETAPAPSANTSVTSTETNAPAPSESGTPTPSPTAPTTPAPSPTPSPSTPAPETPSPSTSPSSVPVPSSPAASGPAGSAAPAPAPSALAPRAAIAPADTFDALVVRSTELQRGRDAAHFLGLQLAATGDHLNYPDQGWGLFADTGNTIDAVLALDATGTGGAAAAKATAWVEANAKDYVTYTPTAPSSGPAGKTLILAAVQGRDPRAFGGLDLIATLEKLVTAEGRFGSADNDYGVTINQALPIIGLTRAGVSVPAAAVDFLAKQQCADGGVRGGLDATTCIADPDATAFAAQAFLAVGDTVHATLALNYLEAHQRADGALTNASGEGANANTTGVAAQAFALAGRSAAYFKAVKFIVALQWTCDVTAKYRGGIAFTSADRAITTENVEQAIRATPQATLGLVAGSLVTVENDSVAAATTASACDAPTQPATTPTPTPTTSVPAGVGNNPGPSVTVPALGGDVIKGSGHGLAYTGASLTLPLSIAGLLLLAGAATILVSRRRGAHL